MSTEPRRAASNMDQGLSKQQDDTYGLHSEIPVSCGIKELEVYYNSSEISDVKLQTADGRRFNCHKLALNVASPVVKAMFNSEMAEAQQEVVELQAASAEVVDLLLQCIYGVATRVPVHLALQLYQVADQYQVARVTEALRGVFTESKFGPDALAHLLLQSQDLGTAADGIKGQLIALAADQLSAMAEQPQFLQQWDLPLLLQVIRHNSSSIFAALSAAVAWVKTAPESRMQYWQQVLLQHLHLSELSLQELQTLQQQDQLFSMPALPQALLKACISKMEQLQQQNDQLRQQQRGRAGIVMPRELRRHRLRNNGPEVQAGEQAPQGVPPLVLVPGHGPADDPMAMDIIQQQIEHHQLLQLQHQQLAQRAAIAGIPHEQLQRQLARGPIGAAFGIGDRVRRDRQRMLAQQEGGQAAEDAADQAAVERQA